MLETPKCQSQISIDGTGPVFRGGGMGRSCLLLLIACRFDLWFSRVGIESGTIPKTSGIPKSQHTSAHIGHGRRAHGVVMVEYHGYNDLMPLALDPGVHFTINAQTALL